MILSVDRLVSAAAFALLFLAPGASAGSAAAPETVWGCFPGATPNPCESSLTTTVLASTTLEPRKVARVETPTPDPQRDQVDCFYVYPTAAENPEANAPPVMTDAVRGILMAQAARFSQVCRVYAPIYRQATTAALVRQILSGSQATARPEFRAAVELGYADVLQAWREYLARHNEGRGVVLVGHSQGSAALIRLLREEIDPDPVQRALIVSAIVPGANFAVARGARVGGDLQHLPTCAAAGETGCVVAYSSFGWLPAPTAYYGFARGRLRDSAHLPITGDLEAACVNPAALSGDGGRLRTITWGAPDLFTQLAFYGRPPTARTPWVAPGDRYTAACQRHNGAHVLRIRAANTATVVPYPAPYPDWGLHIIDVDLAFGNLIDVVRAQRAAYTARVPALN